MHALTTHRLLFLDSAECPVQGADSHACSSCSASKVAVGTQPFTLKTNFSRVAAARIARISPRKGRLGSSVVPNCGARRFRFHNPSASLSTPRDATVAVEGA